MVVTGVRYIVGFHFWRLHGARQSGRRQVASGHIVGDSDDDLLGNKNPSIKNGSGQRASCEEDGCNG